MNVWSLEVNKKKMWHLHSLQNKTTIPLLSEMIRGKKSNFQCVFKFLMLWLMKYCKNLSVFHDTELSWMLLCYKTHLQQIYLVHNSSVYSATISGFSAVAEECIFELNSLGNPAGQWNIKKAMKQSSSGKVYIRMLIQETFAVLP